MHMIKSHENSQFYRFHDNSPMAKDILTYDEPAIKGRKIEILQIAYVDSVTFNMIIEFIYIDSDNATS